MRIGGQIAVISCVFLAVLAARSNGPATMAFQTLSAPESQEVEAEATGASRAFTSDNVAIVNARELIRDGRFADAEALQHRAPGGPTGDRDEMLEIISRLRFSYCLD